MHRLRNAVRSDLNASLGQLIGKVQGMLPSDLVKEALHVQIDDRFVDALFYVVCSLTPVDLLPLALRK